VDLAFTFQQDAAVEGTLPNGGYKKLAEEFRGKTDDKLIAKGIGILRESSRDWTVSARCGRHRQPGKPLQEPAST
jgi:hypothetical protein